MSKNANRPTPEQLKLLKRALREKLGIDTGLAKKKKAKDEDMSDPDEEMAAKGKVARKGYASSVGGERG